MPAGSSARVGKALAKRGDHDEREAVEYRAVVAWGEGAGRSAPWSCCSAVRHSPTRFQQCCAGQVGLLRHALPSRLAPLPASPKKARHAEAALNFSANRPVARPLLQAHPQSGKIAQCATAPDGDKRQPLRALRVVRHGITKKPGTLSRAGPGNSKTQDDSSEGGGYLPPASPLSPLM